MYNDSRIATQLESHAFAARTCFKRPAHCRASCKSQKTDSIILHQWGRILRRTWRNTKCLSRPARSGYDLSQLESADGRLASRAQDNGIPSCKCRCYFMCYKVKWKVKWTDTDNWSKWDAVDLRFTPLRARNPV